MDTLKLGQKVKSNEFNGVWMVMALGVFLNEPTNRALIEPVSPGLPGVAIWVDTKTLSPIDVTIHVNEKALQFR